MNRTIFQFDSTQPLCFGPKCWVYFCYSGSDQSENVKVKTDFGVKASLLSSAVTADVDGVVFMSHTAAIATIG